ncbi:MAG: cytochrome c biogenesis protein CcsA, partial [Acidimicrobiia bacterium]|nr:cytochrome c biogenesis protein CcsA [Acidimicrobiia bacterium]
MLGLAGTSSVVAGTVLAGHLIYSGVRAASGHAADPVRSARMLLWAAIAAFLVLELAILGNDFSVVYVADHHATTTPFPFDVATAWAALEGSIVLWGLVLAVYTWLVAKDHRRDPQPLSAGALAVMGIVALFFFGVMSTIANPFETCVEAAQVGCLESSPIPLVGAEAPAEGRGPNPLLQNHLLMAIHPPVLYLGFVGMTAPFAYAVSALAIGRPGIEWLTRSKRWTTTAWSFLTLGIVLGSWWAYEVLSWGGYWAWDPVENASFIPWLVATAFLHSALVQIRRGMLQSWNFVLVITTFALTILATYLTRSGTVASVHSFTQSAIGPALLGFLVFVTAGSLALFAVRAETVAQPSRMETLISREGAFLANNLILTAFAVMVLVGTTYPIFVEALTGDVVQVGRPFFDRLARPLSFALLLAMGIGSAMPWRVARPGLVWKRIHGPLQASLAAGAATVAFVTRVGWVVAAVWAPRFPRNASPMARSPTPAWLSCPLQYPGSRRISDRGSARPESDSLRSASERRRKASTGWAPAPGTAGRV